MITRNFNLLQHSTASLGKPTRQFAARFFSASGCNRFKWGVIFTHTVAPSLNTKCTSQEQETARVSQFGNIFQGRYKKDYFTYGKCIRSKYEPFKKVRTQKRLLMGCFGTWTPIDRLDITRLDFLPQTDSMQNVIQTKLVSQK